MYYFHSPMHGHCRMEAKTAGKYGFGSPKIFVFRSMDPSLTGEYVIQYRDRHIDDAMQDSRRGNFELVMAAITQFCSSGAKLNLMLTEELNEDIKLFNGVVKNRYGRIVSSTSFLPRQRNSQHET